MSTTVMSSPHCSVALSSDEIDPWLLAESGHGRSASGRRALCQSSAKASFLTLPKELRELILNELLSSDDPIELAPDLTPQTRGHVYYPKGRSCSATKAQRLYPSVLRTCKQLYNEGVGILYNNTISARVSCSATEECCRPDDCVVLSARYGPSPSYPLPKAVIERISKIRIQIFVKQDDLVKHAPRVLSDGARELHKLIESVPQWREVTIDIEKIGDPEDDFDLAMLVVPFSYLRRCQAVTISTPYKADIFDHMASTMMSDDAVVDLHRMYESLDKYRDRFADLYRNDQQIEPEEAAIIGRIDGLMDDLEGARDYGELKEFCEIREQVVAGIAELQAWRHALIFRSDPPGWISGHAPDSSIHTVASERLTQ